MEPLKKLTPASGKPDLCHIVATRMLVTIRNNHDLDWLHRRLDLFGTFTLPSLAAQTNTDFIWILFTSPDLPDEIADRLSLMVSAFPNIHQLSVRVKEMHNQDSYRSSFKLFRRIQNLEYDYLLTSRIDSDDAWNLCYVESVQAEARRLIVQKAIWEKYNGVAMTYPDGQILYPYKIRGKEGIGKFKWPYFSQSLDILTPRAYRQELYGFAHSRIRQAIKKNRYLRHICQAPAPMFLYVQHAQNDGLIRTWHTWLRIVEKLWLPLRPPENGDWERYGISPSRYLHFKDKYIGDTYKSE